MSNKTPGVFVQEISTLPPSVAQVETAIPAFIGYTEKATDENGDAVTTFPYVSRIKSYTEFVERFGRAQQAISTVTVSGADNALTPITESDLALNFRMDYAMQLYFANGGGPCYVCVIDDYSGASTGAAALTEHTDGLALVGKEDEPTILLFPDALRIVTDPTDPTDYYSLYVDALSQCADLGDRVTIIDPYAQNGTEAFSTIESTFRNGIGNNNLKYGITYYPYLQTNLTYYYDENEVVINGLPGTTRLRWTDEPVNESESAFHSFNDVYHRVNAALAKHRVMLPPSAAMAGVYVFVDRTRGVWKAPANVSLNSVQKPMVDIDNEDQRDMNVTASGKSVNAIRTFAGKGVLVWGARTLAGNDNEWRYVPVRRFFNMAEESIKKATFQFVFEPNDANTWVKVRAMIENFLLLQWRAGALAGAKPEAAFYVRVGLGTTMTALDILEGRMNVEIGMAVVRPAEFIILKFSHKMQES